MGSMISVIMPCFNATTHVFPFLGAKLFLKNHAEA